VQGPLQSASAPFSIIFPAIRPTGAFETDNVYIDVANYPASVDLLPSPVHHMGAFQPLHTYLDVFSGVIDGIPIDVKMLRIEVGAAEMTAALVPEPSALSLFVMGPVLLAVLRRGR
jgi:hypothetical protein